MVLLPRFSLPVPGEAGEELWGRAMGTGVWVVVWPWGMWDPMASPRCLFCCLSRATVSGALMRRGSRGLGWGVDPACGPGMWTHSPERHSLFTSGWCSGQAYPFAQPHPLVEEFAFLADRRGPHHPSKDRLQPQGYKPRQRQGRSRVTCAD